MGGVGLGNFQTVEPSYATQTCEPDNGRARSSNEQLVVHNTYLQMAADLGLVGLGLFLAIVALPLRLAGRALGMLELERHELEFHVAWASRGDDRHAHRVRVPVGGIREAALACARSVSSRAHAPPRRRHGEVGG